MIERCPACRNNHETNGGYYFGAEWKTCPDLPENMQIPLRKVPVVIHGPQGERFDSYRYELAYCPRKT